MSMDSLNNRVKKLLDQVRSVEQKRQYSGVVIYNPETGEPCPGYEDIAAVVMLPDNRRGGVWLPEKRPLP